MRLHGAERDRLDSLASYDIVGARSEPELDAVTALAATVCDVPMAAVTVLDADRQWSTSLRVSGPAARGPADGREAAASRAG